MNSDARFDKAEFSLSWTFFEFSRNSSDELYCCYIFPKATGAAGESR